MLAASHSILITDDDFQFRETLRGVLEPRGYRTLLADDGMMACEMVERETIHLLLMDLHMPRLTGLETLRRVKKVRAQLPCILLSARWDDALRAEAMEADAFSLLAKPVSRDDLTNTVAAALLQAYGE